MYETPKANLTPPQKEKGAMPVTVISIGFLIMIEAIIYVLGLNSIVNNTIDLSDEFFYFGAAFSMFVCFYMLFLLKKGDAILRMIVTAFLVLSLITGLMDLTDAEFQITNIIILDSLSLLVLAIARILFQQETVKVWFEL